MLIKKIVDFIRVIFTTALVYTFGYVLTAVLTVVGLAAVMLKLYPVVTAITLFWVNCLFGLSFHKLFISGKENIEKGKPYLIVSNHSSIFDIPAIMAVEPNISWVARTYLFKIPVFGSLISLLGYIPIERKDFIQSVKNIESAGKIKGQSIGIFPEGTRTLDGKPLRFKRGFIRIFKNTHMDILPVTLNGFFSLKPKNRMTIHSKNKLEIIIHKPLSYREYWDQPDERILETVRKVILEDYKI